SAANTSSSAPAGKNITIAVMPKGNTHIFWKSVNAGAQEAAKELNITANWKGPLKENDRAGQIHIVEQFVSDGVDGIVLAPLDEGALARPVQAARAKKIPVVIIGSALRSEPGTDYAPLVATDKRNGGEIAGD